MKKTIGWILFVWGLLMLLGGMTSKVETDPLVQVFILIVKFAMIIGGGYMAFSDKKSVSQKKMNINAIFDSNINNTNTIKDLLPQYSIHFINDTEIKNNITESIYNQKGKLNGTEGTYKFILTHGLGGVQLSCNFTDSDSFSASESFVVGSLKESKELNYIQWMHIIESLKSKTCDSYVKIRADNFIKLVYENNLIQKISKANKELQIKIEECNSIGRESNTLIENGKLYLNELLEKEENGDSSTDLEKLKDDEEQEEILLDKLEFRYKQLKDEIKVLTEFLESDEVVKFISKDNELFASSDDLMGANKYLLKFKETFEQDKIQKKYPFYIKEIEGYNQLDDELIESNMLGYFEKITRRIEADPLADHQKMNRVTQFFIPDNISFLKFCFNQQYDSKNNDHNSEKFVSPSLKFFVDIPGSKSYVYPSWFYWAYPDVAKWFIKGEGNKIIKNDFREKLDYLNDFSEYAVFQEFISTEFYEDPSKENEEFNIKPEHLRELIEIYKSHHPYMAFECEAES